MVKSLINEAKNFGLFPKSEGHHQRLQFGLPRINAKEEPWPLQLPPHFTDF